MERLQKNYQVLDQFVTMLEGNHPGGTVADSDFCMMYWKYDRTYSCGTVACIMGWGIQIIPELKERYYFIKHDDCRVYVIGRHRHNYESPSVPSDVINRLFETDACKFLGLHASEFIGMFSAMWQDWAHGIDINPVLAYYNAVSHGIDFHAARIKGLIERWKKEDFDYGRRMAHELTQVQNYPAPQGLIFQLKKKQKNKVLEPA